MQERRRAQRSMIGPGGLNGFHGSVAAGSVPLVDQRPRRAIQAAPTGAFEAGDDDGVFGMTASVRKPPDSCAGTVALGVN